MTADEELFDIVDKNGAPTGEILPRSVVHERELLHGSVLIWIYNRRGDVLLQLRAKDKKVFAAVWDVSVAGHISAGETPRQAAVREIQEEVGLKINEADLKQIGLLSDVTPWLGNKRHPEMDWLYILSVELDASQLNIQQEELSAVKLESINDIESARRRPGSDKVFADRNPQIYELAFKEILRETIG